MAFPDRSDVIPAVCPLRNRLLVISFSCDPDVSMEDRNGWQRAIQAAENFDVVVLTNNPLNLSRLAAAVPEELKNRLIFLAVPISTRARKQLDCSLQFYSGYRAWLQCAKTLAEKLHSERPFALTHLVSLCGYREPGCFWQLPDCPFILGPVGGTSGFPVRFLSIVGWRSGLFELTRNVINGYQLRFSRRIKQSLRSTAIVIAANHSTRCDLQPLVGGLPIPVDLETGLDYQPLDSKPPRDDKKPLKILWSGRLRAWKGLPLLLHAIAELPSDISVELRVIGDGGCKTIWQKLAKKLGIEQRIEWLPRPPYRDSLPYYRIADVFCFTSLRDTSGTGLLESLAAGTPIIGLNHQGCADIMQAGGGIPVSVISPRQTIREITAELVRLSQDNQYLMQLSKQATSRAYDYCWDSKKAVMMQTYRRCLSNSSRSAEATGKQDCSMKTP